jgi:site-specific DNA recombinase
MRTAVYGHVSTQRPSHAQTIEPPLARRSATQPIGPRAQGGNPLAPEAWQLVAPIPAIVSPEPLAQVHAQWALNQPWASRHNKTHTDLLRALVSCGVCQACGVARTTHGGRRYEGCRTQAVPRDAPPGPPCRSRHIPAPQLEDLVWHDLCELLSPPEPMAYALERAHGGYWLPPEVQARKEARRKGRVHLDTQVERLIQAS